MRKVLTICTVLLLTGFAVAQSNPASVNLTEATIVYHEAEQVYRGHTSGLFAIEP